MSSQHTISLALVLALAGCESDPVTSSIQSASESATVQIGQTELVPSGGRLKLSTVADIHLPVGAVLSDVLVNSTTTTISSTDDFAVVVGGFAVTPTNLIFRRPSKFTYKISGSADRLGVIWRSDSESDWKGLPSQIWSSDSDGDGNPDTFELRAWVFQSGDLAVVRHTNDLGACCTGDTCVQHTVEACTGTHYGPGSSCDLPNVDLCSTQCCLSEFKPMTESTGTQSTLAQCLSTDLWPLGSATTCDAKCCSPTTGTGSVSRYAGFCLDTSQATDCLVCCIDNNTAKYTAPTECTSTDQTGASCETICCASSVLSPVQGFTRVTRAVCAAVAGYESFSRYCNLCENDTDCDVPPTTCQDSAGTCIEGQCIYAPLNECIRGLDCGDAASCTAGCMCEE